MNSGKHYRRFLDIIAATEKTRFNEARAMNSGKHKISLRR